MIGVIVAVAILSVMFTLLGVEHPSMQGYGPFVLWGAAIAVLVVPDMLGFYYVP